MGAKIKISIITTFILTTLFTNQMVAQNYTTYDYARIYSLKKCLDINYLALDSTFFKKIPDITSSLVLQSLSPEQMNEIDEKVKEKAKNYYKEPPYGTYDNINANQIVFFCWELYESKQMKNELKKIVYPSKKKSKKKNAKKKK